jgi:hypothetical protein
MSGHHDVGLESDSYHGCPHTGKFRILRSSIVNRPVGQSDRFEESLASRWQGASNIQLRRIQMPPAQFGESGAHCLGRAHGSDFARLMPTHAVTDSVDMIVGVKMEIVFVAWTNQTNVSFAGELYL